MSEEKPMPASLAGAMKELFADPRRVVIDMTKPQAFILMSGLHLLLRHPGLPLTIRGEITRFAEALEASIAPEGELHQIASAGRNPVYDQVSLPHYTISQHDADNVGSIVAGSESHFGAHLLRLIKKADNYHRRRLASIYPSHVAAIEKWEREPTKHS